MLDVLFLGDGSRAEFREARRTIAETANVIPATDIPTAVAEIASRDTAPLVIVAAAYPWQFRAAQIAELRKSSPLARLIALLGSWCEGEERTGRPWPADARVFWHQWSGWWAREIAREEAEQGAISAFPLTATSQDRVFAPETTSGTKEGSGLVAIAARDYATFHTLAEFLGASGWASAWVRPDRQPILHHVSVGLWDGGQLSDREQGELALFCRRVQGAPVVAMLDFPRIDTAKASQELGAVCVIGKPYWVNDLLAVIAELGRPSDRPNCQPGAA